MDVDGVLTDGSFWWGPNGEEWKRFHFADIMGLSRARRAGLKLALISGEDSPLIDRLAAKMQISDVEKSCKDKARALQKLADLHHLELAEICFMGDDVMPSRRSAKNAASSPAPRGETARCAN
jgi:3-deoxy-D-manno-octulosonate 8-phosphate phosphatase (KDO 8-P phosphatase)